MATKCGLWKKEFWCKIIGLCYNYWPPHSTPRPQTCVSSSYGSLCGQDIFLQIKFSLYNICLEFENASGVETMVSTGIELDWDGFLKGWAWVLYDLGTLYSFGAGSCPWEPRPSLRCQTHPHPPLPHPPQSCGSAKSPTALIPPHEGAMQGWGASAFPASSSLALSSLLCAPAFSLISSSHIFVSEVLLATQITMGRRFYYKG